MNSLHGAAVLALLTGTVAVAAAEPSCRQSPLPLRIHIADREPREAQLIGGTEPGLRLVDAQGREIWSAGPGAGVTQSFPTMNATFGRSLTGIDLDGDGIHDRLYAGDHDGRLWRFDLGTDVPARRWAAGGVFADLGSPGIARGFVAAPDVSLTTDDTAASWFSLAIGSATLGAGLADNRFYVLRDHQAFERRDAAGYAAQPALRESDLHAVQFPLAGEDTTGPGYFIPLGSSQVLASSLTVNGLIHFTVVETAATWASCPGESTPSQPAIVSVSIVRATDGATTQDVNADGRIDRSDQRVSLPRSLRSDAGVDLVPDVGDPASRPCSIAGVRLEGCALDTSPRRTYWRREDAD